MNVFPALPPPQSPQKSPSPRILHHPHNHQLLHLFRQPGKVGQEQTGTGAGQPTGATLLADVEGVAPVWAFRGGGGGGGCGFYAGGDVIVDFHVVRGQVPLQRRKRQKGDRT